MDISQLSEEELEKALEAKKEAKRKIELAARAAYEEEKAALAERLCEKAARVEIMLRELNHLARNEMFAFQEKARVYGGLRANSKGGFSIEAGPCKVRLKYHAIMDFDERVKLAEENLRDFMGDFVKKRDRVLYDLLMSLLEKNRDGNLEPNRVMEILKHEDKFDDPRWLMACKLFRESYQQNATRWYLEFATKNEQGKWVPVVLNFSAL